MVVVVPDVDGSSALHAAYAGAYFGFELIDVVGVVDVDLASVTPCRVIQLRNAASAVELAPVFPANPPPPPKPPEPVGRRLAHALNAALSLELPPPSPPAGGVPPPPPNPPAGGVPPFPPGRAPVGAVTPCDLRQLTNAESEADDFVVVVVVDFDEDVEDVEALPHAASSTPATATPTIATEMERNFDRLKLESSDFPMAPSMKRKSG